MKVTGRTRNGLLVEMSSREFGDIRGNYREVEYPESLIGREVDTKLILSEREKAGKFDAMIAMLGEFAALAPALQNMVLEGVKKHALQTDKELAS